MMPISWHLPTTACGSAPGGSTKLSKFGMDVTATCRFHESVQDNLDIGAGRLDDNFLIG